MNKNIVNGVTPSQKIAKVKIEKFINSPNQFFLLTGKPGVGKTYILKNILADLIAQDVAFAKTDEYAWRKMQVAGVTLAHKAKNVLRNSIPNVFTFAKAFGKRERVWDDGSRTFERINTKNKFIVGEAGIPVYVYDEVSMFTQDMLDLIFQNIGPFSKVIFVGDKAQLPPIFTEREIAMFGRDADSPVFSMDWTDATSHELTERVRQAEGNPILELSDIIREEIFGSQDIQKVLRAMKEPRVNEDGQGYDFVQYKDYLEDYCSVNNDWLDTKTIAFRRTSVEKYNEDVRTRLHDNPQEKIIASDSLFITTNYYAELDKMGLTRANVFNSDEFNVKHVYKKPLPFNVLGKTYRIECYVTQFQNKAGVIISPTEEGKLAYDQAHNALLTKAQNEGGGWWPKFYDFSKNFCGFAYAFAITAHKSQGSTYKTVYVDINDILTVTKTTPKRKLQAIYTAMTRASHTVKFIKSNGKRV